VTEQHFSDDRDFADPTEPDQTALELFLATIAGDSQFREADIRQAGAVIIVGARPRLHRRADSIVIR
jgi:hypothetical protein